MKPAMMLLVLFIAVVMIGCQENQLATPTSPSHENSTLARPGPILVPPPIEPVDFSFTVENPYKSPELFFVVKGSIVFELRESPILRTDMYDLACSIDGEIHSIKPDEVLGLASTKSFDRIAISPEEKYVFIVKEIEVQKSALPLLMNIKLIVYRNTIEVANVWLTTP